jgi:hypothetical protein
MAPKRREHHSCNNSRIAMKCTILDFYAEVSRVCCVPGHWPPSRNREHNHTPGKPYLMSWACISANLMTWEVRTAASIGVILVCAYCGFTDVLHPDTVAIGLPTNN